MVEKIIFKGTHLILRNALGRVGEGLIKSYDLLRGMRQFAIVIYGYNP